MRSGKEILTVFVLIKRKCVILFFIFFSFFHVFHYFLFLPPPCFLNSQERFLRGAKGDFWVSRRGKPSWLTESLLAPPLYPFPPPFLSQKRKYSGDTRLRGAGARKRRSRAGRKAWRPTPPRSFFVFLLMRHMLCFQS